MTAATLLRALSAVSRLGPDHALATQLAAVIVARVKRGHRGQPFAPVELARIRRVLATLLDAVDAAEAAEPEHFRLVGGSS